MIYVLAFIALELLVLIYLTFKRLPIESQKEVLRKVEPIHAKIVEWQPPKSEEEIAEETARG